jgi:hypothetical protein
MNTVHSRNVEKRLGDVGVLSLQFLLNEVRKEQDEAASARDVCHSIFWNRVRVGNTIMLSRVLID